MRIAAFVSVSRDINLEAIGKAAISAHNATQKHKNSARQTKSNQSVKTFFKNQSAPTTLNYKTAAAEGTWNFHTVKHQQSFLFNNSTSHFSKHSSLTLTLQKSLPRPERKLKASSLEF